MDWYSSYFFIHFYIHAHISSSMVFAISRRRNGALRFHVSENITNWHRMLDVDDPFYTSPRVAYLPGNGAESPS